MVLVQAKLLGDCGRDVLAVAGEHDAALDTGGVQVADGLLGIVFYHVCDHDMADVAAVHGYVQDGARELAIMPA